MQRPANRPGAGQGMNLPDNMRMARGEIALDTLTLHIAEELAHLAQLSLEVQDGLSACITACSPDIAMLSQLQSIDRIGQGLADLGRLMAGLTGELPGDVTLQTDALRRDLRLRELADRLVPLVGGSRPAPSRTDGDILWF